jgi:hypothetical protein
MGRNSEFAASDRQRIIASAMANGWTVKPRGPVYQFKKGAQVISVGFDEDGRIVRAIVKGKDARFTDVIKAMRSRA